MYRLCPSKQVQDRVITANINDPRTRTLYRYSPLAAYFASNMPKFYLRMSEALEAWKKTTILLYSRAST